MPRLARIVQYPLKGFPGRGLERAAVGQHGLVGDRAWALRHPTREEHATPDGWVPRNKFLQMMFEPWLAALEPRWVDGDGDSGQQVRVVEVAGVRADLGTGAGRRALAEVVAAASGGEVEADRLEVVSAAEVDGEDRPIRERAPAAVSLAGLPSLRAFESIAARSLGTARFKMNLWLDDLGAWQELDWCGPERPAQEGRTVRIGTAVFRVWQRCDRCRQIQAGPGARSYDAQDLIRLLQRSLGHRDLGVLMAVQQPGVVAVGDRVEVVA